MASQESAQKSSGSLSREKMGRSRRGNWFIRFCCCCCSCCCSDDDVHRPLLHSTTPKELTPAPIESSREHEPKEDQSGEETQQVQLVVADVESTLDSESEHGGRDDAGIAKGKDITKDEEKPLKVDLEPTERARVSSGTFVRGTDKRASWRLVPSFTEQVKEATNGSMVDGTDKEATPANQGNENHRKPVELAQTEQSTEQISFKSDENHLESTTSDHNVTLVEEDVDDDDSIVGESVTMTFTIGSRGNQGAVTMEKSPGTNDEQKSPGQGKQTPAENMTSSALVSIPEETKDVNAQASDRDTNLETSMDINIDIDQPTTPILTQQHPHESW